MRWKRPVLFKLGPWHFQQDKAPAHNSVLVTDYLSKMCIKTVPKPPYSTNLAPCDFSVFRKLRGCRYETIEEMKNAMTKVIDMLTQEDFHWVLLKCVLSTKVPIRKKSEDLLYVHRFQYIYIFITKSFIVSGLCVYFIVAYVCQKCNVSDFLICPFLHKYSLNCFRRIVS